MSTIDRLTNSSTNHAVAWGCILMGLASVVTDANSQTFAAPSVQSSQAGSNIYQIVHECGSGTLGGGDGEASPKRSGPDGEATPKRSSPDGEASPKRSSPDGKSGPRKRNTEGETSNVHSDLAIHRVVASKSGVDYRLSYCVVNRGGKPAHAPTTVQVRIGDLVLSQETYFKTIGSQESVCFGSAKNIEFTVPSLEGTTIAVTAAANEYSTRDNICRVKW